MPATIPSLAALQSNDEGKLASEFRLARLRSQLAVVRSVADHLEHLTCSEDIACLGDQLREEMALLGCRLVEAAETLAEPRPHESGVFLRRG